MRTTGALMANYPSGPRLQELTTCSMKAATLPAILKLSHAPQGTKERCDSMCHSPCETDIFDQVRRWRRIMVVDIARGLISHQDHQLGTLVAGRGYWKEHEQGYWQSAKLLENGQSLSFV
ncbi:unnamed protein product [Larinioides sclopetarius]|uniref:Uncharacterized protein n=1 Tax=Larinioides sclopetarius TaxID=280406 RepID=A0AAV2AP70_9ARAC